jgi:SAM-dependent methyltransferase
MAERLMPVAERVVAAAQVGPSMAVLDVACGTGNAALMAAAAGARVTGVDITPELLAIAATRAQAQGLRSIEWKLGDAGQLDLPDGAFDRVLTVFGAMYAPDQARAAAELARVLAPSGLIVSAAWTPDGFMAATNRAIAHYLPPPPPGATPPTRWGDAAAFARLLEPHGLSVTAMVETLTFTFSSLTEAAQFWADTAGHLQAERPRLEVEGRWSQLLDDLQAVFMAWNTVATGTVSVGADYLLALATARGR